MQRMAWTDERLEERFDRIDLQLFALRSTLNRTWIAIVAGFFGIVAAILVKGG
jgi:hypothetical protein